MECGHSSICFDCTMRLAIKSRTQGKLPYCHLCRKPIKYALKIQVPEEKLKAKLKDLGETPDYKSTPQEDY